MDITNSKFRYSQPMQRINERITLIDEKRAELQKAIKSAEHNSIWQQIKNSFGGIKKNLI